MLSRQAEVPVKIYVEKWLRDQVEKQFTRGAEVEAVDPSKSSETIQMEQIHIFDSKDEVEKKRIHYAVTLGGDGTILYAAKQFIGRYIPPIISFAQVSKNSLHFDPKL